MNQSNDRSATLVGPHSQSVVWSREKPRVQASPKSSLMKPEKLNFRTYRSLEELSSLRAAWDELLSKSLHASTFCTWEWLSSWWTAFGKNSELFVLGLFDSSELVGLAPLAISKERAGLFTLRVLRFLGDGSGDSDNLDFPVQPGMEPLFAECLVEYLRHSSKKWDLCLLNTAPASSPVATSIMQSLKSSSWTNFNYSSRCSEVPLPETWEEYSKCLSSEDRKNLVRYTRRLHARYSARIYRCSDPDQLPSTLSELFRLHQERWTSAGKPGAFASVERRQFYGQLSALLLSRGELELWVLELNGEIAAVQFGFRYRDTVFQLQEGYSLAHGSDRVGFVLRGEVLKTLISEGARTYDFLGGEDSYKARWGALAGTYRHIHFARSFSIGAAWLQIADKTSKGKEWLRKKIPANAWNLLHKAHLKLRFGRAV